MPDRIEANHWVDDSSGSVASLLDEWIREVGEEGVAAVVAATIRGADDGSIPSFTGKAEILADWTVRYPHR